MKKLAEMSNRQIRQHYNSKIRSLSRYKQDFETEMNIKNSLYAYIIGRGMYDDLVAYSRTHDMRDPGAHERATRQIGMRFPEYMN